MESQIVNNVNKPIAAVAATGSFQMIALPSVDSTCTKRGREVVPHTFSHVSGTPFFHHGLAHVFGTPCFATLMTLHTFLARHVFIRCMFHFTISLDFQISRFSDAEIPSFLIP